MSLPLTLTTALATIGGEAWIDGTLGSADRPLVVALHGGGFSRAYFTGLHPLPAAVARAGADIVLLDRPGANESVFRARDADILTDNAAALDEAIATLWDRYGSGRPGVFLIGHSIGGAIALMIGARRPSWPLLGVAVSGIGDRPPAAGPVSGEQPEGPTQPPLPRLAMAHIMLAPAAVNDAALDALEAAAVPVVTEELAAIVTKWPAIFLEILAAIDQPIQIVLSQHEVLWHVDAEALDRIGSLLDEPRDELVLWSDVGHCIDFHDAAPRFLDAQLAFMNRSRRRSD